MSQSPQSTLFPYTTLFRSGRIRKKIDFPMKLSLISVVQMILPLIILLIVLLIFPIQQQRLSLLYGFCIFFGWITSMIFGMTFKTLPFIICNCVYHNNTHQNIIYVLKIIYYLNLFSTIHIIMNKDI